jgi:tRNA pseudouridine38-40 synthase
VPDVTHLKLTVAYDGTGLVGWQRQASGVSVQGLLEEALAPLAGAPVSIAGAGRTDAGVHALAQVASVSLARDVSPDVVRRAMNVRLPPAVRVTAVDVVDAAFHARFRSTAKTYRYRLCNAEVVSPFEQPFVWHVPWPLLDVGAMRDAAARLAGHHDFAAFQGAGTDVETSERTIYSARVQADPLEGGGVLLAVELRGDGFLRHMVRAVAGTLVEVGRGRRPPAWMDEVLASKTRGRAGRTAPPQGLFLVGVEYD